MNPAAVLPRVFHHNTMELYTEVLLCPSGKKELKKKSKRCGKKLFWMNAPYIVSFQSSAKLPGSSWNRMGISRKFTHRSGVKTHHSCFAVGGPRGPFRKQRSFISTALLFLSPGYEKRKRSLEAFYLFRSFHTYAGHKESVNSTLNEKPSVPCETKEYVIASERGLPVTWQMWGHVKLYKNLSAS